MRTSTLFFWFSSSLFFFFGISLRCAVRFSPHPNTFLHPSSPSTPRFIFSRIKYPIELYYFCPTACCRHLSYLRLWALSWWSLPPPLWVALRLHCVRTCDTSICGPKERELCPPSSSSQLFSHTTMFCFFCFFLLLGLCFFCTQHEFPCQPTATSRFVLHPPSPLSLASESPSSLALYFFQFLRSIAARCARGQASPRRNHPGEVVLVATTAAPMAAVCLVHTLHGRERLDLVRQRVVVHGAVVQADGARLLVVNVRQRVLHPVRVVTVREVVTGVRSPRLRTRDGGLHGHVRAREQVLELERLNQVGVPHRRLVVHDDVLELLVHRVDLLTSLQQQLLRTEDGRVQRHGLLHGLPQARRRDVALVVQRLVQARDRHLARVLRERVLRAAVLRQREGDGVGARLAEDDNVEEGVGTQAVGTVHRRTRRLTRGQQTRDDRGVVSVPGVDHLTGPQRGDATHGVVHRGHNGHRLLAHVDAGEGHRVLGDAGQLRRELLLLEVVQLEVHVVLLGATATALKDLEGHGARDDVTRRQVLQRRRVTLHETLALRVDEQTALGAAALRHQHTRAVDAGGVELHELHVGEGQTRAGSHGQTVAGARLGRRAREVGTAVSAGRQDGVLRAEAVEGAVLHRHGHDTAALAVDHDQIEHEVLVEEVHAVLERLSVQRVEHRVARAVRRRAATDRGRSTEVEGLSTERTLVDEALLVPREGHAHLLQLSHGGRGLLAHVLDGVLVTQPVSSLHGVIHVPSPVVLCHVRERRVDTTLGRNRVRPRGEKLRDACAAEARSANTHGSPQTRTSGANNNGIERVVDDRVRLSDLVLLGRQQPATPPHHDRCPSMKYRYCSFY
eukprot:Rhum_TRINITY_DN14212_c1_g1::Rhum_TRINITY_DN14212_c1_g1_i1::g.73847::m.73847